MGNVVDLLPGHAEIRNQLITLREMHDSFVAHKLRITNPEGVDVTAREAAIIDIVIIQLQTALGRMSGGRSKEGART